MTLYDPSFYEVKARMISVLANSKRLEIVGLLREGECRVSDLAVRLNLAQAATSQHLAVLRKAGVVDARKAGSSVFYRLASPKIAQACDVMGEAVSDLLSVQEKKLRPFLPMAEPIYGR